MDRVANLALHGIRQAMNRNPTGMTQLFHPIVVNVWARVAAAHAESGSRSVKRFLRTIGNWMRTTHIKVKREKIFKSS